MRIINIRKTSLFRTTNIVLIYALFLNITVPFAQTMNELLTKPIRANENLMILPGTSLPEVVEENSEILITDKTVDEPSLDCQINEQPMEMASVSGASPGGSGFSLNTSDNLVDPFTGDFTYSLPLMDVEGYPIVLSYNSNVTMNTEASWVGLGWNLNVGSVEREMRGIPDEFDGTQNVVRETNQLDDITTGGYKKGKYWKAGISADLWGYVSLSMDYNSSKLKGSYNNTYLGLGQTYDKSSGFSTGASASIYFVGLSIGGSWGKYYSYDSKRGVNSGIGGGLSGGITLFGVGPNLSTYSSKNFNSREGMTGKTITRGWGLGAGSAISMSRSHTSTIPYGSQTQVPRIQLNSTTIEISNTIDRYFNAGLNLADVVDIGVTFGKLKQFYSSARTDIKNGNTILQPAIGFLHSSKKMVASGYTLPIMDFNRSNDTRYSEAMTNLPFSMQTFDIFHANAMGMQGTFRAHRADAGTYKDAIATDESTELTEVNKKGGSISTYEKEVGFGLTSSKTSSKNYTKLNGTNVLEFTTDINPVNGFDQAAYFKGVGETTPVDGSLYANLGGLSASRVTLLNNGEEIALQEVVIPNNGSSYTLPPDGKVTLAKPTVATYFRPRTASELTASPIDYEKNYYSYSSGSSPVITTIPRTTNVSNIISRVEVTSDDGIFYGYGIPCFSNSSSQVLFNIGSNSGAPSITTDAQGLVTYSSGDNTILNNKGLSQYYDKTTVPSYAESFLLTDMHGSDYVDRTGNGPTVDDIGSYFKFNYTKLYGDYHWRFPVGNQKAFYMEGTVGSELDDMASYSAGSKEIWVTHSVESKNYIAEFILDLVAREDGYGIDDNGNKITGEKTYALKQINLYAREDRKINGVSAKPVQVVEFTYTYELCQNYPSNTNPVTTQRGKLTLKTVSVYTGKSFENQHSYYQFDYGTGAVNNPDFNYGTIDAWGELKPGSPTYNSRFPYVDQSQTSADNNVQAWKLKRITSPNGGLMEVTYEADRYGYVQNKRVMKHMVFEGLTNIFDLFSMMNNNVLDPSKIRQTMNTSAFTISTYAAAASMVNLLYNVFYGRFHVMNVPNNIVIFKLDDPIPVSNTSANQKVKEDYFTDNGIVMKELYLKAHILVTENDTRTEIVPLFAGISNDLKNALSNSYPVDDAPAIGVLPPLSGSSNYTYGYVVLTPYKVRNPKEEELDEGADALNDNIVEDEAFNPIQKAAFDFFQRSLTDIVYQNTAFSTGLNSLDLLTGARMEISKAMRALGFGTTLMSGYNTMRVYIPSNVKYGGGSRVKSIQFSDNWQAISGEYTSNYKANYVYDFAGKTSGVASYESRISNDESSFYQWDSYYDVRVRFPDKFNYTPTPIMELLYPSGSIGYSKVAVQYNDLTDRGYLVSEFYTAKDKPTLQSISRLDKQPVSIIDKNKGRLTKLFAFSQGFSLETNDFHGKIKSNAIYKASLADISNSVINANLLSKTTYNYYNTGEKQKFSDEKGAIQELEVGIDYDIHADSRLISNITTSLYGAIKKVWMIPSIVPFPHSITNGSLSYNGFYSHALVKHANRSAILKSVETEYMGSKNLAENIVFDRYSGSVILSSLKDEFDDVLYSLDYPAHWYYSELRNVSSSQDKKISLTLGSNTTITNAAIIKQLSPGDKLKFPNGSYAWVAKAYPWPTTPTYFLITESGSEFSIAAGTYDVIVHASGRSNEITATMQEISTKKNPLATPTQISFPTTEILSGGAITLRDRLNVLCKASGAPDPVNNNNSIAVGIANPYLYGIRGNLIPDNQLAWQSGRIQATTADGVRKDGAYSSFIPYYAKNTTSGEWFPLTHPSHPNYSASLGIQNWRKSGEGTLYDQYGAQIEIKDPLRINSALLYGYNPKLQLLPVAIAQNAHKQDIAFDGFEDYSYYTTQLMDAYEPHFSFLGESPDKLELSSTYRHSGKYSTIIAAGKKVNATRFITPFQEAKTTHADNGTNTGQVQSCDCINTFSPTEGEYVIGAWVKQPNNSAGSIEVTVYNSSNVIILGPTSFTANSTVLDGWQRIEGTLIIPSGAAKITVSLKNNTTSEVYFDDFRMHPFQAGMVTTVYDPNTLLKTASHDGYNFTTFYNYDENNQLVRVRVETSEGIKTISESEMSVYKQP